MSATTFEVHVSGIAPQTTEQHLNEFFSFCGKISRIDFHQDTKSAVVHFEKASAAKTALMLNGGTLDGSQLSVTSPSEHHEQETHHEGPIDQSDKPRAGIAAEYLARGYKLSDQVLQRAIELDNTHGISNRFLSYISSLDTTLGEKTLGPQKTISGKLQETLAQATEQAKTIDQQRGISTKATDYYSRALSSPWGQKVKAFYTTTSKQVFDIHEEARRIASENPHAQPGAPHDTGISTGVGTAAPPVSSEVRTTTGPIIPDQGVESQSGSIKTGEAPVVL
ncbi:RRM domain-containing protein [Phanerochaete sordida]|uniref:RRM domain-containing protein n=1 Tax=Phanerochaete sordida TaxID=48140 RepID=A0A9P3GBL5_9APHY|nr:RRM domain-containing protein [Phanerochaete sordida]